MEESAASKLADSAENHLQPAIINGTEHGLDVEMKDELAPEVSLPLSTNIQGSFWLTSAYSQIFSLQRRRLSLRPSPMTLLLPRNRKAEHTLPLLAAHHIPLQLQYHHHKRTHMVARQEYFWIRMWHHISWKEWSISRSTSRKSHLSGWVSSWKEKARKWRVDDRGILDLVGIDLDLNDSVLRTAFLLPSVMQPRYFIAGAEDDIFDIGVYGSILYHWHGQ
jgi:hypothetical protein